MISRLTACAATFAVLATASIAFAASTQHSPLASTSVAAKPVRIVQLERVTITAKRLAPEAR
jgi:hypothetical protein